MERSNQSSSHPEPKEELSQSLLVRRPFSFGSKENPFGVVNKVDPERLEGSQLNARPINVEQLQKEASDKIRAILNEAFPHQYYNTEDIEERYDVVKAEFTCLGECEKIFTTIRSKYLDELRLMNAIITIKSINNNDIAEQKSEEISMQYKVPGAQTDVQRRGIKRIRQSYESHDASHKIQESCSKCVTYWNNANKIFADQTRQINDLREEKLNLMKEVADSKNQLISYKRRKLNESIVQLEQIMDELGQPAIIRERFI